VIKILGEGLWVHLEGLQELGDAAIGLLKQGEQQVLGIDLMMAIALHDLGCSHGSLLGIRSKAVNAEHESFRPFAGTRGMRGVNWIRDIYIVAENGGGRDDGRWLPIDG
jgi:hypothetical protein